MAQRAVIYSPQTLHRKIWLDQAATALLDYRDPSHIITGAERAGLAAFIDYEISPADAAERFQAMSVAA